VTSLLTVPLVVAEERIGALTFCFAASGRRHSAAHLELARELGEQVAIALRHARLYEAEQRARGEAESANRTKAEFLAAMSHELRTPLNAIAGYVDLLDLGVYGGLTEAQRGTLARVRANQAHLLALINDLLSFASLDSGAVAFEVASIDLDEFLTGLDPLLTPQAEAKEVTLSLRGVSRGLRVLADPERLRQILLSLLGNAIKFTPSGGSVRLAARPAGSWAEVEVRDTGPGIAPELQDVVFNPFVQLDRRLDRPQDGVGLGLAISRDLARGMGGEVTLRSAPGEGSIFTLRLPRADVEPVRGPWFDPADPGRQEHRA
jgi:signal transduction histidine kinase